jgi:transposase
MKTAKTRLIESTAACPMLMLAFELGESHWVLGFTISPAQRARRRQIPAGDVGRLLAEVVAAKRGFDLPADAPVTSCYEAGREGFCRPTHN